MSRKSDRLVLLLISLVGAVVAKPKHLIVAETIAREIRPADNSYAHSNSFIRWKGEGGADRFENRTDCSEFFNLLIEHVYGIDAEAREKLTGHARPYAEHWYDAVHDGKAASRFETIDHVSEIRAGDIVLIKFQPEENDTGHLMIIADDPKRRDATGPVVEKTTQWEVPVVDCSKSGHGTNDTRAKADGGFWPGVGEGVVRLYFAEDDTIAGYAWSVDEKSKFVPVSEHRVIIARFGDAPTTKPSK